MTDDTPAAGQSPAGPPGSPSTPKPVTAPPIRVPVTEVPPRWQSGPERIRAVAEAERSRLAMQRQVANGGSRWILDPHDEEDGAESDDDDKTFWRPAGQAEWVVMLLVSLYAEARSQQKLTGFSRTTRWVLDAAAARVEKAAVSAVPLKLLQGLYLALGPRQKGWALWSHPATARRTLKAKGASR